jgi:hypothetical protein
LTSTIISAWPRKLWSTWLLILHPLEKHPEMAPALLQLVVVASPRARARGQDQSNPSVKPNPPANTPPAGNVAQASSSRAVKLYTAKLDSSGKLKPEEQGWHMENNLCIFCGGQGHKTADCQKCLCNAQGKAGAIMDPPVPATDTSS